MSERGECVAPARFLSDLARDLEPLFAPIKRLFGASFWTLEPDSLIDELDALQSTLEGNMSRLYETARHQLEERGRSLNAARRELRGERARE